MGPQMVPFSPTVPFYLEVTQNVMLHTQFIAKLYLGGSHNSHVHYTAA